MINAVSSRIESKNYEVKLGIKIAQINLQHKKNANDILMSTVESTKADIILTH